MYYPGVQLHAGWVGRTCGWELGRLVITRYVHVSTQGNTRTHSHTPMIAFEWILPCQYITTVVRKKSV